MWEGWLKVSSTEWLLNIPHCDGEELYNKMCLLIKYHLFTYAPICFDSFEVTLHRIWIMFITSWFLQCHTAKYFKLNNEWGVQTGTETTGERKTAKCRIGYQPHIQALDQKRRNSEGNLVLLHTLCASGNKV